MTWMMVVTSEGDAKEEDHRWKWRHRGRSLVALQRAKGGAKMRRQREERSREREKEKENNLPKREEGLPRGEEVGKGNDKHSRKILGVGIALSGVGYCNDTVRCCGQELFVVMVYQAP
ncbi:hypothetical protein PIB30_032626 [Stylosanthes scabra]|uniref:Uncharacterized protein n=1 Tax=Stylosanthes scabra TaxID=79078 RepID=A0ABU6UE25_9FABA|nr:hypothetical protein [Stylosanthes scabra]